MSSARTRPSTCKCRNWRRRGFDYAILRRNADGARKDVLSFGEPAGAAAPMSWSKSIRPGTAGERFIDAPSEIAARIVAFYHHRRRQAGGRDRQQIRHRAAGRFRHRRERQAAPLPRLCAAVRRAADADLRLVLQRRARKPSIAPRSPARSTGSPSFPPAATPKSPACSRTPSSSAPSAAQRNPILAATPERNVPVPIPHSVKLTRSSRPPDRASPH